MGEHSNYNIVKFKLSGERLIRLWEHTFRPAILYCIEQPFLFIFFLVGLAYRSIKFTLNLTIILTQIVLITLIECGKVIFRNAFAIRPAKERSIATIAVLTIIFTIITVNKNNETSAIVYYDLTIRANNTNTQKENAIIKSELKEPAIKKVLLEPAITAKPTIKSEPITKHSDPIVIPPDIIRLNKDNKNLAITFDGGSNSRETLKILNTLRKHSIETTIFLAGSFIKKFPDLVLQMVEDGHEIGNHTLRHKHITNFSVTMSNKSLPYVTEDFIKKELIETNKLFRKLTGLDMAPLWRAPYGEINEEVRYWAYKAGYIHVNWTRGKSHAESLDTLDWVSDKDSHLYLTSTEIANKVIKFALRKEKINGGIILMHLGTNRETDNGANGLGYILSSLKSMGYNFKKVTTLIKEDHRYAKYLQGYDSLAKTKHIGNNTIASLKN